MKIITTLIGIIGFQYISFCQTVSNQGKTEPPQLCSVIYSENPAALIHSEASKITCREITIAALPPATQSLTILNVDFGMTGAFTFVKDKNLEVYNEKDVYIEDMLTGKIFDFKTSDTYSFNVNRKVPGRFVLHIDNLLLRYSVSSN